VRGHGLLEHCYGLFEHCHAYISGPEVMVRQTALLLAAQLPASHIHHDPLSPAPVPAVVTELSRSALYAKFGPPLAASGG
jgi:hypothetical protein